MADDIPTHRASFAARSGDTHVIGKDGKAVNADQQARDEMARKSAKPEPKAAASKPVLDLAESKPAGEASN